MPQEKAGISRLFHFRCAKTKLFPLHSSSAMPTRTHTLKNERRDFVEWHRGRAPYVLWAIDVDLPEVRDRVARATEAMADWLLDGYERQPHVTLALCGFPTEALASRDEFSESCLLRQVEALRRALAGLPAFDLQIGELATFDSAPYLAVADAQGAIAAIRRALTSAEREAGSADGVAEGDPAHAYVPHVTVGLYRDRWPLSAVHERIGDFSNAAPLSVCIDRISLLAYDPREIGGALTRRGEFLLDRGVFRVLQGASQS